ncbi:MAG: TetR/AcrR family transcriptional regulator [Rhodobacteraceae bacterium]|jgi:AcrR family transcriptional regulator|nr:TetR/AcrR family transcriptional regulator [Paracoccaceae bacterium]
MPLRKRASDRKAEIVAAALRLADAAGPDRPSTAEIARAVGLTQAGLFRHFPTRAALWQAAAAAIAADLEAGWAAALSDAGVGPRERLAALVAAQLAAIERCPALPAILFSPELNADDPAIRARFAELLGRFQGYVAAALGELAAEGALRATLAPADAAVFVTTLIQGLAVRWRLGGRRMALAEEGMRLFRVQAGLFAPEPG